MELRHGLHALRGSMRSERVQPPENAALLGLLRDDMGRLDIVRDIGGGGFLVNARPVFTRSLDIAPNPPLPSEYDSASVRAKIASPGARTPRPRGTYSWLAPASSSAARSARWQLPHRCPSRRPCCRRKT